MKKLFTSLFTSLFTKKQESAPSKALLELEAIHQRNQKRMAKIKEEMGDKYIVHPSPMKSRLDEPRPV